MCFDSSIHSIIRWVEEEEEEAFQNFDSRITEN